MLFRIKKTKYMFKLNLKGNNIHMKIDLQVG